MVKGDAPGLSRYTVLSSVLKDGKHLSGRSRIFWESGPELGMHL